MTEPDLEQVAMSRKAPQRDCRTCAHFEDEGDGLAYGWCRAHVQFVKLYHGRFWSQCQFKFLSRERVPQVAERSPSG